jgi:hypothetical protein
MTDTAPHCEACDGIMHSIRLIDKQHPNKLTDLEYAPPDTTRSCWTGRFPGQGKVEAYLCGDCGRIALFGQPFVTETEQTHTEDARVAAPRPKTTKCFSCGEPIPETADRCPACGWSKR